MFIENEITRRLREEHRLDVGRHTYGSPSILWWGEDARLDIGAFSSIAEDVTIFLGGNHRPDWVTTFPFSALPDWGNASSISGHPATKGNVSIGNDVWVGYGATILSGVSVGDGAVIGARSVVTKNVAPYTIVAGNPAQVVRTRFDEATVKELLDLKWWSWSDDRIREQVHLLMQGNIGHFLSANIRGDYWSPDGETFLAWGSRLARELGATFKIRDGQAVFAKRGTGLSPLGQPLPFVRAAVGVNLVSCSMTPVTNRARFGRARVRFFDRDDATFRDKDVEIEDGVEAEDGVLSLATDEAQADEMASGRKAGSDRDSGAGRVELTLTPLARAEGTLVLVGARPGVDGTYRITVKHTIEMARVDAEAGNPSIIGTLLSIFGVMGVR